MLCCLLLSLNFRKVTTILFNSLFYTFCVAPGSNLEIKDKLVLGASRHHCGVRRNGDWGMDTI